MGQKAKSVSFLGGGEISPRPPLKKPDSYSCINHGDHNYALKTFPTLRQLFNSKQVRMEVKWIMRACANAHTGYIQVCTCTRMHVQVYTCTHMHVTGIHMYTHAKSCHWPTYLNMNMNMPQFNCNQVVNTHTCTYMHTGMHTTCHMLHVTHFDCNQMLMAVITHTGNIAATEK